MRIAYVTVVFPKDSETFACTELRALRRAGVRPSVHALLPAARYCTRMLRESGLADLPVTHAGARSIVRGTWTAVRRPRVLAVLLRTIARHCAMRPAEALRSLALAPRVLEIFADLVRERPAAVHLYWGHYPALVGLLIQRFAPEIPVSMFLGAYDLLLDYGPSRAVARRASFVRTLAQTNVPTLLERATPPASILVSHHGIDLESAPAAEARACAHRLVTAARLIPAKRVDLAIRVLERVRRVHGDATLEVLGDGEQRSALEALAAELGVAGAVEFRGHVPHSEVFASLRRSDVLLLPSEHPAERLPNVVKEAMASRCGCVVSPTPGIDELIDDGVEGYVVDPRDLDATVQAVLRWLAGGPHREAMLDAASRRIREHFDVAACVAPMIERWSSAGPRAASSSAAPSGRFRVEAREHARTRVLVVSSSLAEGGAERFASTLVNGLDRRHFAPSLCLFRDRIEYPLADDVALVRIDQSHPLHTPRSIGRLRDAIGALEPDVILSCGAYTSVFTGQALRPLASPPRWIARVGDDPARHPHAIWARAIVNARLRSLYARADAVVANSDGLARAISRHFPGARVTTLPSPVDFAALAAAAEAPACERVTPGRDLLVAVGRLHAQKRPSHVLAALARLEALASTELWWCGDGPEHGRVQAEIDGLGLADRVRLLGFRSDAQAIVARAALVVSASTHEGLPTALIEAQGLGVPVVATRCDYGLDEVVTDGETGLLVEPGDPGALAAAIDELLSDPERRLRMGKRAAEHARARYDATRVLSRWQALLAPISSAPGARRPVDQ